MSDGGDMRIDGTTLVSRLRQLGQIGRDEHGRLSRLAASDADKAGRDLFVHWAEAAGLDVEIDRIGNIFATLRPASGAGGAPIMVGSHIDTVTDAGFSTGATASLPGWRSSRPSRPAAQSLPRPSRWPPSPTRRASVMRRT